MPQVATTWRECKKHVWLCAVRMCVHMCVRRGGMGKPKKSTCGTQQQAVNRTPGEGRGRGEEERVCMFCVHRDVDGACVCVDVSPPPRRVTPTYSNTHNNNITHTSSPATTSPCHLEREGGKRHKTPNSFLTAELSTRSWTERHDRGHCQYLAVPEV